MRKKKKKVHISAPLLSPALDGIIPKLGACQYKYVSLASFTGTPFFQMIWLANFQLANLQTCNSQTCNSPTRKLAARTLPRLNFLSLSFSIFFWLGTPFPESMLRQIVWIKFWSWKHDTNLFRVGILLKRTWRIGTALGTEFTFYRPSISLL